MDRAGSVKITLSVKRLCGWKKRRIERKKASEDPRGHMKVKSTKKKGEKRREIRVSRDKSSEEKRYC